MGGGLEAQGGEGVGVLLALGEEDLGAAGDGGEELGEAVEDALDALQVPAPAGGVRAAAGEGLGDEAEDLVEEPAGGIAVGVDGGDLAGGGRRGLAQALGEIAPATSLMADVAEPCRLAGVPAR